MLTEHEVQRVTEAVLAALGGRFSDAAPGDGGNGRAESPGGECLPDIAALDLAEKIYVPNPQNPGGMGAMKKSTPARIGVWRAGPRYLTETLLRFRADHALAMDAVFNEIPKQWLEEHRLPCFKTLCENKDVFMTRPDLGRRFGAEEAQKIKAHVGAKTKVVVYVADGLSTTAVSANAMETWAALADGLARHGIEPCAPFFVQYGRVPSQDAISEITGAEVVCTLIGERPGLITAESMSAYMAYKAAVDMPEARRTVVSNIHRQGTPAVEAGGYLADIVKMMLDAKASGIDLKL
ncbi:MAG: ethanolamine ammonia-lyase subunit EutC [Candidatus Accumulibacter sp.]|nr:ethanolamine ammonia-lyase subunit EutC [Accumulibacter sp.]